MLKIFESFKFYLKKINVTFRVLLSTHYLYKYGVLIMSFYTRLFKIMKLGFHLRCISLVTVMEL